MWPLPTSAGKTFPSQFGFEPCYVNSRLVSRGIPETCKVNPLRCPEQIYRYVRFRRHRHSAGYQQQRAQVYDRNIAGKFDYKLTDTFMGFYLRQHAVLQDVRRPCREVPADPAPSAGVERAASPATRGTPYG